MFKTIYTYDIYLKSGAVIKLTNVLKFSLEHQGNEITKVDWKMTRLDKSNWPLHVDLREISAVVQTGYTKRLWFR